MNNKITIETYNGYKKLYSHKKDLLYLKLFFISLDILSILSCIPINISSIIIFFINQLVVITSIGVIMSDYKQKTKLLMQSYPYIDNKIKIHELKSMLKEYKINYEKQSVKLQTNKYEENLEEVEAEINTNYLPLKYTKNEERVKVKVKTLIGNKRL